MVDLLAIRQNMTGIILSGGKNSRMGVNKAFLEINGVRLIDHILSVYRKIFSEIIIVTNEPLAYTEFPDTMIVTDIYKGKGSLGGIYTGLFYARNDYAFVAACDMPSLNIDFILFMMEQIGNYEIVVPELPEGFQALHAIYSRRCLPAIQKMILADKLKISGLFKDVRSSKITEDKIKPFNQDGRLFLNLNTPEDLHSSTLT
ncbi:MAG TPA: molybdenum cofactor guanylyltransferase [Smithella sp.]|nr:molybdenum cofactor guanylyltransferase [Smithella sp.]HOG89787.1 molybdenum cofactor guanylyltransferase [Smithella sp.]HOU50056.1 molybdenum cofactor guanylyltransferase [Smithella sp.]HQG65312.1 molybdenum cofactor guanylyltransferase [Smithella sp.]HQH16627.1 molybdenum cofactor guanylyltransferase [Smithella sp.]